MSNVRIGVIGVGHLGQHHARLLAAMDGVDLVGVCDVNRARADEIGTKFGAPAFSDARELVGRVDAVTVAVPTVAHLDVGLPFLQAGVATLIEKPIAPSVADADRLVEAAERAGAMLATGHTERFNPAVAAALPIISGPRFIEILPLLLMVGEGGLLLWWSLARPRLRRWPERKMWIAAGAACALTAVLAVTFMSIAR